MINVNGLKRNAKNIVKKYSDAQIKVREATSNDPWGPSSTIMAEIADLTYNVVAFSEIMQMIWKRLNDHDKNWRHVYKALVLLEYLIKTGTEKVAQQCIENIFAIQTLKDFQYMEENKDYGMNIREKSKKLVALLKDSEKLKAERARALKAKSRLAESVSSVGKSSLQGSMMGGLMGDAATNNGNSSNGNSYMNYHNSSGGSGSSANQLQDGGMVGLLNSDIDSARPQTLTEEENQLKLALALSKEEAEKQEKTRKNDELRLKLALDVSKKTASSSLFDDFTEPSTSGGSGLNPSTSSLANAANSSTSIGASSSTAGSGPSKSTIDDLLGLTIPPPPSRSSDNNTNKSITDITTKGDFLNMMNTNQDQHQLNSDISTVMSAFPEPQNDPWSVDPWSGSRSAAVAGAPKPSLSTMNQLFPLNSTTVTASAAVPHQPMSAFNDLISSTIQSMPRNQAFGTPATSSLGNGIQTQVPPGVGLASVPLGPAQLGTTTNTTSNNIFNNLTSGLANISTTANKRPMSSKNPFQD